MASSPSSQYGGNGSRGRRGRGRGRGRGGDFEGPSSSRRRRSDGVWPEPFLEALAVQVAVDAFRSDGRLAAAPALFNLFQVCSRWQAVSRSDLLWRELTRRIWNRRIRLHHHPTWREEFIFRHRTARNFRTRRYIHTILPFIPPDDEENNGEEETNVLLCRRLALSDHHLAAGFSDGSVHLFHLAARAHVSTLRPQHRDLLGRFSRAVSGIILSDPQVVFASHDGDIYVGTVNDVAPVRRAQMGAVVSDGALVDFSGCSRWWVGLYAGVPGRAFHVWNGLTEELLFVGGTLTDPEAVMGWHLLTDSTDFIARVRVVPTHSAAVACTSLRVVVLDLTNLGIILAEEEFRRQIIVGSVDAPASDSAFVAVDSRGLAILRRVGTLEEICRFNVRGAAHRALLGCMNSGYAVMCVGGVFRVWEAEHGEYLYIFRERVGEVTAVVADERYVVACSSDTSIHLWDFGAQ